MPSAWVKRIARSPNLDRAIAQPRSLTNALTDTTKLLYWLYTRGQDGNALGQPIRHYKSRFIRFTYVKASVPDRTHCTVMQTKLIQKASFPWFSHLH